MNEFLLKNPLQKLLSIVFAIMIWYFAPSPGGNNLSEIQFFVPMTYGNLPKNLEIISEPLRSVSISIEVPRNEMENIHPSQFQAVIDLDKAIAGSGNYRIYKTDIKTPPNVKIISISPNSIDLTFEAVIEKELPIHPVFSGELAKGYVIKKIEMIPDKVSVKGPISIINQIVQLETKTINIESADTDIDMVANVILPERVTLLDPKPEYYSVKIEVGSEPINIRFDKIPLGIINQIYLTRINPKHINVLLRGPRSIMDNFSKIDIQAFIDLKDFKPGTYKLKAPTVRIRPEIQIQKIWPPINVWVLNQKVYE